MKAQIIDKKQLNSKVGQYDLEMVEPMEIKYLPGQFIRVLVAENVFRSYSIYSDYKEHRKFSLAVTIGHEGYGSNYFRNINIGDVIDFRGPVGMKILPQDLGNKIVFVSTGTGITHTIAFLYQLEDMNYKGEINLYWGLTKPEDIYLVEELNKFMNSLNFNYHMQYSTIQGRVDKLLDNAEFKEHNTTYYLCGHNDMVKTMNLGLIENGISKEKIYF